LGRNGLSISWLVRHVIIIQGRWESTGC
jgi:hypothetical protein